MYTRFARVYFVVSQLVSAEQSATAVHEATFTARLGWETCTLGKKDTLETVQKELQGILHQRSEAHA